MRESIFQNNKVYIERILNDYKNNVVKIEDAIQSVENIVIEITDSIKEEYDKLLKNDDIQVIGG